VQIKNKIKSLSANNTIKTLLSEYLQ